MKRLLFLLLSLTTLAGYAQYPISSINITMPPSPAANTAAWATVMPPVMITAQAPPRNGQVPGDVQESRILVTIKQGGSKKYGAFTQDNAPSAGFTTAVKTWSGGTVVDLLGKDITLPPGSYELCVQFFSFNTPAKPLSSELCKSFTVADAQPDTKPITNIGITMSPTPPANTANWGIIMPPVMITAQTKLINGKVPQEVIASRILVTIKQGGSKKYGAFTQNNAPESGFTTAVKTWSGASAVSLLGQDVTLPPGSYELCVQLFTQGAAGMVAISDEKCKPFTIQDSKDDKYTPPTNINPADKQVFTDKDTKGILTFRWTPVLPRPRDPVVYKLKVWQLMQGQTSTQAMQSNQPVLEKEVKDQTQATANNFFTGPCKPPYMCNWVWRVEGTDGQRKVLGVSEATAFNLLSGGGCQQSYDAKIDSITCLSTTTYKLFGKINCYNSGYGPNSGYTIFPTKVTLAQVIALPSGTVLASSGTVPNVVEGGNQAVVFSLLSVPAGTTKLILHFDTKVLDPNHNCIGEANDTLKLPNCACNPCKDKQTSFGKDSSNSNNAGQVNMLSTVSHGPNKVIKVSAQIVDFERLGENGCLRCTKDSKEFGNYIGGSLNGNGGIIVKGSYGKQIQWQFSTPTSVSGFSYDLNMMFPPLTDVSCCKDSIRICTRWSFTDEKCITCDTLICKVIVREYKVPPPYNPHGGGGIYAIQMAKMGEPYNSWYTQKGTDLPKNFTQQVEELYRKTNFSKGEEMKIEPFTENMRQAFISIQNLKTTGADAVWNVISGNPLNTQCGNGDFETGLNTSEWSGAYGSLTPYQTNDPSLWGNYSIGFNPSLVGTNLPITVSTNQHSITNYGNDATIGALLKTTSSFGNINSFRIGNQVNGAGSEMISKKFVVSGSGIIKFIYAAVLNDPGHGANSNPGFWVKVYSATGIPISNVVYLEPTSLSPLDHIVANANPFFQTAPGISIYSSPVRFRDWTCGKIDLSQFIGQTVSVAFITNDCTQTGHFGYAYIDNWCGDCSGASSGSVNIKVIADPCIDKSPQVCVDYTLPKIGTTTGNGTIKLEFYQNGILVPSATLTSPTLTSGTTYCFTINPAKLPCNGKGYDVVATGNFMVGSTPITVTSPDPIGSPVVGIVPGQNNDLYCCYTLAETCCLNFKKTVTATTTMVGNATAGYNTIKIVPTFTVGPKPIKKVVISIVNFETNSSNKECLTCESNTGNYGSMSVPNGFGASAADPIEGMYYPSSSIIYTCLGCPPTWNIGTLTHEVTWGSNSGPGYDLMDGVGDQSTTFFVHLPKKSTLSCCDDTIKVCVKYSFTDIDCKTCDTIICYKIINRQPAGTTSTLINSGDGFNGNGSSSSGASSTNNSELLNTVLKSSEFLAACDIIANDGEMLNPQNPKISRNEKGYQLSWDIMSNDGSGNVQYKKLLYEFGSEKTVVYFDEKNVTYTVKNNSSNSGAKLKWPPSWWPGGGSGGSGGSGGGSGSGFCGFNNWSSWVTTNTYCGYSYICVFNNQQALYRTETRYCKNNPNNVQTRTVKIKCGC